MVPGFLRPVQHTTLTVCVIFSTRSVNKSVSTYRRSDKKIFFNKSSTQKKRGLSRVLHNKNLSAKNQVGNSFKSRFSGLETY